MLKEIASILPLFCHFDVKMSLKSSGSVFTCSIIFSSNNHERVKMQINIGFPHDTRFFFHHRAVHVASAAVQL